MFRSAVYLTVASLRVSAALAHELPDGEIERCVQVCVEPTRVAVQYSLGMSEATLKEELRARNIAPAETLRGRWQQYQQVVFHLLAEQMHLFVDGEPVTLNPYRTEYLGWRHRHLVCRFEANIRLTKNRKKIVFTDSNFPNAAGHYRIAMKGRAGARVTNSTVPAVATRATPVELVGLGAAQKQSATRAEGDFYTVRSPQPAVRMANE